MKAIILAAGRGERLRPLTDTLPKPMVPIMGKPALEYLILLCKDHGINEIAINTSYLSEKIKQYFGTGEKWGVKLYFSYEPKMFGTSGALNNFRDLLKDDDFFVIYGDNVTDIDLTKLMQYHKAKDGIVTTALRKKHPSKPPASLLFINSELQVTKFVEKPSDELFHELCKEFYLSNSGLYVCSPKILNYIPKGFSDFAKDIFPYLLTIGEKIYAFMMDEYYFREIGKIEKYELCKNELESKQFSLSYLQPEITREEKQTIKLEKLPLQKNKAIFLDRDGVINEIIYDVDGKLMSPSTLEQLRIIKWVKEGIQKFKKMGFKIIIITNQPGVAFGYISKEKLKQINEFLKKELDIDKIYSCPHHPKITGECDCRKPKIGLIEKAKKDFNIDLGNSYFVGDSLSDIQTGKNANVKKTFRIGIVRLDMLELQHKMGIFSDFTRQTLIEVADKISEIENSKKY